MNADLLQRLLDFYKRKYSDAELSKKFNDACKDLVTTGDVSYQEYKKFSVSNEIKPFDKPVPKSSSNDCGHGSVSSRC